MTFTDTPFTVQVASITPEAADILSILLVDPAGRPLPAFTPGAHIDVHVAPGIVRQYSLCNGPADLHHYQIAVKREPQSRGGSAAIHERLAVGDRLTVGRPRNNFPLERTGARPLLLAGGIGITPILSMARHLAATGEPFALHYFARSATHAAFLDRLAESGFGDRVRVHLGLDRDGVERCLDGLFAEHADDDPYVCGPQPFIELARATAGRRQPSRPVRFEYFAAPAAAPDPDGPPPGAFLVEIARTGATYLVPEDRSIVDVLEEQGVHIEVSCKQGICGTCLVTVLEGVPEHHDHVLSDANRAEGKVMLACVSRAKGSRLVLDL